jgi:hypothetical protein
MTGKKIFFFKERPWVLFRASFGPAVGEREDMVGVPPGLEELSAPGALVLERERELVALGA